MKKIFWILLVFVLAITPCYAKSEKILINGNETTIDTQIIDDLSFVPLKDICNLLDLTFNLNSDNSITIENKDKSITLQNVIGDKKAIYKGQEIYRREVPTSINNTTYVFLRDICGMFNYTLSRTSGNVLCVNYSDTPLDSTNPDYYESVPILTEAQMYESDRENISAMLSDVKKYGVKISSQTERYIGKDGEDMWYKMIDVFSNISDTTMYTKEGDAVRNDCALIITALGNACNSLSKGEIYDADDTLGHTQDYIKHLTNTTNAFVTKCKTFEKK